jgi:type IV pilus assembly protein PilM
MHEDIAEVIFSGGCALLSNFSSMIAEKTGIETRVAEPFRNIRIPKKFEGTNIQDIAPVMAIAVGLALRRLGDR